VTQDSSVAAQKSQTSHFPN